jgi:hypothetical protein
LAGSSTCVWVGDSAVRAGVSDGCWTTACGSESDVGEANGPQAANSRTNSVDTIKIRRVIE